MLDVLEISLYLVDLISDTIFHVLNLSSEEVVVPKKPERRALGYLTTCGTNKLISSGHHYYIIENSRLGRNRAAMISSLGTHRKVL